MMVIPLCTKCGLNPLLTVELLNATRMIKVLTKQRDAAEVKLKKKKGQKKTQ